MSIKLRLLICHDCREVIELPDFTGPPEYDVLLDQAVSAHRFPNGEEHVGALADVEKEKWDDESVRQEILKRIGKPEKETGFGGEFYAAKNTFAEDAMKCFNEHGRPKQGCIDYKDERKRLGNPTSEGWRQGPRVYLCDFCPIKTWVVTQQRSAAGMYDRQPGEVD